jgi:hypothetical protein
MFPVLRLLDVEMLRDGGSLEATFEIEGGREFSLRIPIAQPLQRWNSPVLIEPAKPLASYLKEGVPVPWEEARKVLGEMASIAHGLSPRQTELLLKMTEVAAHNGHPPPSGS